MTPPFTKEQIKRLRKAFRMPAVQTMTSRKTSITNAFVSAIIPVVYPSYEDIAEALAVLGMTADSVSCIYCGDKCNAWDHFHRLSLSGSQRDTYRKSPILSRRVSRVILPRAIGTGAIG